jgi:aryl-alcohol dehydrogenase-like predicted oxidoreductase
LFVSQIPYCQDTGVGLIPWSPVARGALTRPWNDRSTKRAGTSYPYHTHMHLHPLSIPYLHPLTLFLHLGTDKFLAMLVHGREDKIDQAIISRVEEVAKKHNVSMATIATAWCVKKGVMPIIGLSSKERIDQAVENVRFKLSDEDAGYLEEMYVPKVRQGF